MVIAREFHLNEIFGRAKKSIYEIPKYQRGYSWEKTNVDEFSQDLTTASDNHKEHFFGSVFVTKDTVEHTRIKLVDGQQRITTSAIFLICARDFFYMYADTNQLAKDQLKSIEEWLYMIDDTTHLPDPNRFYLTLSRTNRDYFAEVISVKGTFDSKESIKDKASNDSNELLAEAYLSLSKFISSTCTPDDDGMRRLNNLAYTLVDQFELINITVEGENDAYKMFNLINNRGSTLEDSDLIKNILFAELDRSFSAYQDREERLDDFDTKWAEIRDNITGQDLGNYDLDNYFHHYLIAFEFKTLQFNQIFTHFLKLLERANPDEIITQLQNWSRNFVQIRNPKEKFDRNPRIEHYLTKIKNIKSTYLYPVVISGFKNYWQKGDKKSFERLVEICFKYHIRVKSLGIGVVLSSYQQKLYNVADRINSGESVDEIIDVLIRDESTYPSDLKLTPQLDTIKFTNSNLAIALLEELENEENPQYVSPTNVSLEHIMPKNISHWNEYIAKKHNLTESNQITALHAKYCNYLGNMALLSDPSNIRSKNKPFEDKKLFYEREGFHITKNVGKEQDWTTKEIEERQKKFTKKLLEILNIEKCKLV